MLRVSNMGALEFLGIPIISLVSLLVLFVGIKFLKVRHNVTKLNLSFHYSIHQLYQVLFEHPRLHHLYYTLIGCIKSYTEYLSHVLQISK